MITIIRLLPPNIVVEPEGDASSPVSTPRSDYHHDHHQHHQHDHCLQNNFLHHIVTIEIVLFVVSWYILILQLPRELCCGLLEKWAL